MWKPVAPPGPRRGTLAPFATSVRSNFWWEPIYGGSGIFTACGVP
jgi:hypothetical protein